MHALRRFATLSLLLWLPGCFTPGALTNMRESERLVTIGVHRAWLTPAGGFEIALQAECEDEHWQAAWISIPPELVERAFADLAQPRGPGPEFELPRDSLREGKAARQLVPAKDGLALGIVRPGPDDYQPETPSDTDCAVRDFEGKHDYRRGERLSFEIERHWGLPGGPEQRRFSIVLGDPDGSGSERPGLDYLLLAITGDALLLGTR